MSTILGSADKSLRDIASQVEAFSRLKKKLADKAAKDAAKVKPKTGVGDPVKGTSSTDKLDTTRVTAGTSTPDLAREVKSNSIASAQYKSDLDLLQNAYNDGKMDGIEYQARMDYLNRAAANGTYTEDREGGVVGLEEEQVDDDDGGDSGEGSDGTGSTGTTDGTSGIQPIPTGTGISGAEEDRKFVDTSGVIGLYNGGGARLTQFVHTDGSTDDERISYIKLEDPNRAMASIASGEDKQTMELIYELLTTQYTKFIVTSIQESRAERSSIMATVGDSFAATFSGREPMVISVQGSLIFDYDRTRSSWYSAFLNAYEYYLRASRLAKYKTRMKLVLPDNGEYLGYMLNVGTTLSSDNDMVVPMSFSMLVVAPVYNKAYGASVSEAATKKPPKTITSDSLKSAAANAVNGNKSTGSEVKDPSQVGAERNAEVNPNGNTTVGERNRGVEYL